MIKCSYVNANQAYLNQIFVSLNYEREKGKVKKYELLTQYFKKLSYLKIL